MTVPSVIQGLISVLLTGGISVLLVWAFHAPLLKLANDPKHEEDDPSPKPPPSYHLSGRIIQVTSLGFVFLFSFTVAQFMLNSRAADKATQLEANYFARSLSFAEQLPANAGRDAMVGALANYKTAVVQQEWPLMQRGDAFGAYTIQEAALRDVSTAVSEASAQGAADSPIWDALTSSIDDMSSNASDRLAGIPGADAVNLIWVVIFLGAVSLAMTSIFQPARMGINLVLIGIMGGAYGVLFFMVVELSNPFQGTGAVTSLMAYMQ